MKKIIAGIILITAFSSINAQVNIEAVGGYGGIGSIKGNSTGVTSFTTSLFLDTKLFFSRAVTFRTTFFYARKFEALLPANSDSRYFPFHKGFSIKAVIYQPLSEYIFLEEGIGPLLLNDRTFSDTNEWAIGAAFHVLLGIDFRNKNKSGFKLGAGSEMGTTFNATTPQFLSVHLQTAFYF